MKPQPATAAPMYSRLLDLPSLCKGGEVSPKWRGGGASFVYASGFGAERRFLVVDPMSGKRQAFFDEEPLRAALTKIPGNDAVGKGIPLQDFSFLDEERAVRFEVEGRRFDLNLGDYSVHELSPEAMTQLRRRKANRTARHHPAMAPDPYEIPSPRGGRLLRVETHNLWIRDVVDNRSRPITTDGVDRFGWGASPRWSPMPDIWSPDGNVLAAFKVDSRQVRHMPVIHWLGREEEVRYHVYASAGGVLVRQELHFIDVVSGARVPVNLGIDAAYFRSVGWHPQSARVSLLLAVQKRQAHRAQGCTS